MCKCVPFGHFTIALILKSLIEMPGGQYLFDLEDANREGKMFADAFLLDNSQQAISCFVHACVDKCRKGLVR